MTYDGLHGNSGTFMHVDYSYVYYNRKIEAQKKKLLKLREILQKFLEQETKIFLAKRSEMIRRYTKSYVAELGYSEEMALARAKRRCFNMKRRRNKYYNKLIKLTYTTDDRQLESAINKINEALAKIKKAHL